MKKSIYLIAYTQTNLGDDLFVHMLCNRYPNHVFYLNAPAEHWSAFLDLDNLKPIGNLKIGTVLNGIAGNHSPIIAMCGKILRRIYWACTDRKAQKQKLHSDAIVKIGGSIFMEKAVPGKTALDLDILEPIEYSKKRKPNTGLPYFIIGANLGPIYTKDYLLHLSEQIMQTTSVVFRDKASYHVFQNFPKVHYAPDVILGLAFDESSIEHKRQVFISVVDLLFEKPQSSKEEVDRYYEAYQNLCRYYHNRGYTVLLVSFCSAEGDKQAIERVYDGLSKGEQQSVKKVLYDGNISNILCELCASEYIICGRFHCMILSMVLHKPFFPVCYSKKMSYVLQDLNFKGNWCYISQFCTLKPDQIDKNHNCEQIAEVDNERKMAEQQFAQLDVFLNAP